MRKTIVEGDDPFAERPPLGKRLIKGLAIAVAVLVTAIGGLAWFRFQPAFTQPAPAAIAVIQPAWGTAAALPSPASQAIVAPANAGAVVGPSNGDGKAGNKARAKPKAQTAKAKSQPLKAAPTQVAKTP